MLRALVVVLFAVPLLLGGCSLAPKAITKTQSYVWSVQYSGGQGVFVCKKVEVAIYRDRRIPNSVESSIVDERFCSKMAKPTVINPASAS